MNQTYSKKGAHPATKHASPAPSAPAKWIKQTVFAFFITLAVAGGLLLLFSFLLYFSPDPNQYIRSAGLLSAGLTAFAGGFIAVRIHGQSALICGVINGGLLTMFSLFLAMLLKEYSSGYSTGVICLLHIGALLLSIAGAYLGLKKQKRPRRRKK